MVPICLKANNYIKEQNLKIPEEQEAGGTKVGYEVGVQRWGSFESYGWVCEKKALGL